MAFIFGHTKSNDNLMCFMTKGLINPQTTRKRKFGFAKCGKCLLLRLGISGNTKVVGKITRVFEVTFSKLDGRKVGSGLGEF
jgi:hypothetical protein